MLSAWAVIFCTILRKTRFLKFMKVEKIKISGKILLNRCNFNCSSCILCFAWNSNPHLVEFLQSSRRISFQKFIFWDWWSQNCDYWHEMGSRDHFQFETIQQNHSFFFCHFSQPDPKLLVNNFLWYSLFNKKKKSWSFRKPLDQLQLVTTWYYPKLIHPNIKFANDIRILIHQLS